MKLTIKQALEKGLAAQKEGKLLEAERIYQIILKKKPNLPEVNYNLGVVAFASKNVKRASRFFKAAVEANPNVEEFWLSYIDALILTDRIEIAKEVLRRSKKRGFSVKKFYPLEAKIEAAIAQSNDEEPTQNKFSIAIKLREEGKFREAQDWLCKFIETSPNDPEAYSLLSQVFLLDKKEEQSEQALVAATSLDPDLPSIYRNQSRLLLAKSKPVEALEKARLAYNVSTSDPENRLLLAACLRSNKRDEEALDLIEKVLKAKPNSAEAYASRALIRMQAKDLTKAILDAEEAVAIKPHFTQMWVILGSLYYQLKNLPKAIQALKKAHKNEPNSVTHLTDLANLFREDNKIGDSIHTLKKAINLAPRDTNLLNNLGTAFRQDGKIEDAQASYEKALAINSEIAEVWANLGAIAMDILDWDSAINCFEKALEIKPGFAGADNNLGISLQELGRLAEAESRFRKAISIEPDFAEAHSNLGSTLQKVGRLTEAEASFRKAIIKNPDFAEAHSNLGSTLQNLGRLGEAESSFRQAILKKSDFAEAHNNLGCVLLEFGRLEEAEQSFINAIAVRADIAQFYFNLGNGQLELGKLKEAEINYRQALELQPDFAMAYNNLGLTLNAIGKINQALHCFSKCCDLLRGENQSNSDQLDSFKTTSKAKIEHDIEQFEYLEAKGVKSRNFGELAAQYRKVASEIEWSSDTGFHTLSEKHLGHIKQSYNRVIHRLDASRLRESAVDTRLDAEKITRDYFRHEFGLTYFDNFLSPPALNSLREFLLESTIWFAVKKGGYLGAYLREGFASPLILQIAEDLKKGLPEIFRGHALKQAWAYKYDSRAQDQNSSLSGIKVHADFAAVNVNFWITSSEANLDSSSGGLVIHNVEAPMDWNFTTYNSDENKIREEIKKNSGEKTVVPYKENRIVLFNSNLFHETDTYCFKQGYENRRINVTMLFGNREDRRK